ncbi:putative reverse transcriptase domain-containing protein, partial [Tanacetum coccineum]
MYPLIHKQYEFCLALHTEGKKKVNPLVILGVRFTKLIINHLQSIHKFHKRPGSPLHLTYEESAWDNLKFSIKKHTKKSMFLGMGQYSDYTYTENIRSATYYPEYVAEVAKYQRYLSGEVVSDDEAPAPKPAKGAKLKTPRKPKPQSTSSQPPKPKPLYGGEEGELLRAHALNKLVDEFVDEGVPADEPSTSGSNATGGDQRKPNQLKFNHFPEYSQRGKESWRTPSTTEPSGLVETLSLHAELGILQAQRATTASSAKPRQDISFTSTNIVPVGRKSHQETNLKRPITKAEFQYLVSRFPTSGHPDLRIGELEQCITDQVDANQALEERLDKQGNRIHQLETQDLSRIIREQTIEYIDKQEIDRKIEETVKEAVTSLSLTTNPDDQSPGSTASGSSKTATTTTYTAWTTTTSRFEPSASSIPEDVFMHEETKTCDAQDMMSDVKISAASTLASNYVPPPENSLLSQTGDIGVFIDWFCKKQGITELTSEHLEGPAYEVVKAFHPDVIHLQFQMEECHKLLTNQVDNGTTSKVDRLALVPNTKMKVAYYHILIRLGTDGSNQWKSSSSSRANIKQALDSSVVTCTFSLNDHFATVLFDSGADFSFISTKFVPILNMKPNIANPGYVIEIADGKKVKVDRIIRGCKLELGSSLFTIDLIPLGHGSFDVIVGMDWLSHNKAVIVCHEKVVEIPLVDGEILRVHEERVEELTKALKNAKVDEPKISDISLVREFVEVFPDDLKGLPPQRQVEFRIELIPGATPVAKSPYRLAPSEMQELSKQLKELQDKGARYFSKIDLRSGYHPRLRVPVKDDIRKRQELPMHLDNCRFMRKNYTTYELELKRCVGLRPRDADKMYYDLRDMYWWPGRRRHATMLVMFKRVPDGTRLDMSTAYHPQTDGQSERTIKTLGDMLRACVIDFGGSWDVYLSLAEFSYNNSYHSSIRYAPFEALYGRKLVLIKEKLKAARDRQKSYADNRRKPLEFEEGDRVMLKVSPWKGIIRFGKKGKLAPRNKKDKRGTVIKNKARLVAQEYIQEEGIDYDEVFAHVAKIEAIRLLLAYASFKDFVVYQMDIKSAFLYNDIIFSSTKKSLCIEFEKMMHKKFQMSSMGELIFFLGLQVKQKEDGIFISQD